MTANQERLDQITARAQTATPGPWLAADEHGLIPGAEPKWCVSRMDGVKWLYDVAETVCDDEQVNAEFIAAAREDVPWLLSVVRDQAEQITALQEALRELVDLKDRPLDLEYYERKPRAWQTARRLLTPTADVPTEGELA